MSFKIVHLGSDWLSWLYFGQIRKCKGVICCSNIIICALSKFNCSHMNNYKWIKDLEEKEYETTVSLLKGRTSWSIIATLIGRRAQLKAYLTLLHSTLLFFTGVAFFFFLILGKTFHPRKDYDSLYRDTEFITVVWDPGTEPLISPSYACVEFFL